MAEYFEKVVKFGVPPKLAANWVMGELSGLLNRDGIEISNAKIDPARLAGLVMRTMDNTISSATAKIVVTQMWDDQIDADSIIESKGLQQITDSGAIERVIAEVMAANPRQLSDYRSGKDKLFGFFVGQVMKATGGKANPAQVNDLLKRMLAGP